MNTEALLELAKTVRKNAYAPYSKYMVGAAVLGSNGKVYLGVNVENSSFGLTICAERNAIAAMIADGCQTFALCVVVTEDGGTPCGACRQVLREFVQQPDEASVHVSNPQGNLTSYSVNELLPNSFQFPKL